MHKETRKTVAYFYGIVRKEHPRYFVTLVVDILMTALLPFINILLPGYIIDELMGHKRTDVLLGMATALVLLNWAFKSVAVICSRENNRLEVWFEHYFQSRYVEKCMEMNFEHTENPEVLNQAYKASEGMGWYSGGLQGLSNCFRAMAASFITLCGVLVLIVQTSPLLFVIALLSVAGGSFVISRINRLDIVAFNKGPQINRAFWYFHDIICDARFGKDIRLYGTEEMLTEKGRNVFRDLYHLFKDLEDGKRKWGCLSGVIALCESVGIYFYLGYFAVIGKITVGRFTMLVTAAITFRASLQAIITQLQELEKKANFMKEYKDFMAHEDVLKMGEREVPEIFRPEIVFQNVSFRYPRTQDYVLKDINIVIRPGEHLAVVGLNGAGKTTFVKLLCRLYDVTEGAILINGVNIQEYRYEEYMKLLSVVFQDFKLFSMSFRDNIRLGDWDKETTGLENLCELSGLTEKLLSLPRGLDTLIYKNFDREGIEPSGGEAQKMAITRAIFKDAPVIVLDEPTAALDPLAEYEVYRQFDRLVGEKTAVYISHRLSSCKFCDKIAVFDRHTIAEYGTHEELVGWEGGVYAKMFAAQAQYYV